MKQHGATLAVLALVAVFSPAVSKEPGTPLPRIVNPFGEDIPQGTGRVPLKRVSVRTDLNQRVLNYTLSKLSGPAVGNVECWTLADLALASAGARRPGRGNYGLYVFGKQVPFSRVRPGDIVQFDQVRLTYPGGNKLDIKHHTAIVSAVEGNKLQIIQQNAGSTLQERRTVSQAWLDLSGYQRGAISYWRPQTRVNGDNARSLV